MASSFPSKVSYANAAKTADATIIEAPMIRASVPWTPAGVPPRATQDSCAKTRPCKPTPINAPVNTRPSCGTGDEDGIANKAITPAIAPILMNNVCLIKVKYAWIELRTYYAGDKAASRAGMRTKCAGLKIALPGRLARHHAPFGFAAACPFVQSDQAPPAVQLAIAEILDHHYRR